MNQFGLLSTGFLPKRLPDIKADFEAEVKSTFGNDVNLSPQSVFGQLIGIYSKHLADLWELSEIIYNNQTVAGAEGISLDHILQLVGLSRLPAERSSVFIVCYGADGTQITADDSIVSMTVTKQRFKCASTTLISKTSVVDCTISVTDPDASTYVVQIGSTVISLVNSGSLSEAEVAGLVVADINSGQDDMVATDNLDGTFNLRSADIVTGYSVEVSSTSPTGAIEFIEFGSSVPFLSDLYGAIDAPANTLQTIETSVSGWDRANNLKAATAGRPVESDAEARIRRENGLNVIGSGTIDAIRSRLLQEVSGVISVSVFENTRDVEYDGRPPHSFEAVVDGGDFQEIAEKIWEVKPAGIASFGSINGGTGIEVVDSTGTTQWIKFSIPNRQDVYMKITLTYYDEETFPADGITRIKDAIVAFGNTLPLGKDLILQRFFEPVYSVSGIEFAEVTWAVVPEGHAAPVPGDYVDTNLEIGSTAIARFDITHIDIH